MGPTHATGATAPVKMLVWLFAGHHNGSPDGEFDLFLLDLSSAVFTSAFLWLLYVALEPFVRRRWPNWIISWSRLLAADFRDPLIGRDILIGAVFGVGMVLAFILKPPCRSGNDFLRD